MQHLKQLIETFMSKRSPSADEVVWRMHHGERLKRIDTTCMQTKVIEAVKCPCKVSALELAGGSSMLGIGQISWASIQSCMLGMHIMRMIQDIKESHNLT